MGPGKMRRLLSIAILLLLGSNYASAERLDSLIIKNLRYGTWYTPATEITPYLYSFKELPPSVRALFPVKPKGKFEYYGAVRTDKQTVLMRLDHSDASGSEIYLIVTDTQLQKAKVIKWIGTTQKYYRQYDKGRTQPQILDSTQVYVRMEGFEQYVGLQGIQLYLWTNCNKKVKHCTTNGNYLWREVYQITGNGDIRELDLAERILRWNIPKMSGYDSMAFFPTPSYRTAIPIPTQDLAKRGLLPASFYARKNFTAGILWSFLLTRTMRLALFRCTYTEVDTTEREAITDVLVSIDDSMKMIDRIIIPIRGIEARGYNAGQYPNTLDVSMDYIHITQYRTPIATCSFEVDGGWISNLNIDIPHTSIWKEYWRVTSNGSFVRDSLQENLQMNFLIHRNEVGSELRFDGLGTVESTNK